MFLIFCIFAKKRCGASELMQPKKTCSRNGKRRENQKNPLPCAKSFRRNCLEMNSPEGKTKTVAPKGFGEVNRKRTQTMTIMTNDGGDRRRRASLIPS